MTGKAARTTAIRLSHADLAIPPTQAGMSVGLFGGSFDPPHAGHRHAAIAALRQCRLDRLWWLVTPGNPLKDRSRLAPLGERLAAAKRIASHPRIVVSALEAGLGMHFTADVVSALRARRPQLRFVLVIGADNWADFHRWHGWKGIAQSVPIAVVDRPGATYAALAGPAARRYAGARIDTGDAALLPRLAAPAWCLLTGPRVSISSTELRRTAR